MSVPLLTMAASLPRWRPVSCHRFTFSHPQTVTEGAPHHKPCKKLYHKAAGMWGQGRPFAATPPFPSKRARGAAVMHRTPEVEEPGSDPVSRNAWLSWALGCQ